MSPLDHKLLRDLARMKGQAAAIAAVIGLGVLMQVMMGGLVNTLEETRAAYYDRYRLADIFAPVTRAPERMVERIARIEGVAAVETRVVGSALVDMDEHELPVRAMAVSLPDSGTPRLNDVYLSAGRLPSPGHGDEVAILSGFAKARGLKPGDTLVATMNGAKRQFQIVGFAESPEFLYTTAPGELVPDDARFAVLWMRRGALEAAYDLKGGFNEALIALNRGANSEAVEDALDRVLDEFGATGAYGVELHGSNRFISEEIRGLRTSSSVVPPIFLAVAAFLLYIVISRMVQAEREEIGLLKAFGYTSFEVSSHYLKFVLVIAVIGAALGSIGGIAAGRGMALFYQVYFKFPFLVFDLDNRSFVIGFLVSIIAASGGSLFVLRQVFALTPAVAMRPPAPADYSAAGTFSPFWRRRLDQPTRMVLRRVLRHPGRIGGSVIGVGTSMALSVATLTMMEGFDTTVELSFSTIDRSDMAVSFVVPLSENAGLALARYPGVEHVEPLRVVPAIFRNGLYSYNGALEGRVANPALNRVIDENIQPIEMRSDGVILGQALADILHIAPGDTLTVEVREGRRPTLKIPVIGTAKTLMGAPVFMEMEALNRALKEPGRISGAFLTLDAEHEDSMIAAVKDMPAVAGVSQKEHAREALVELMNTGPGAMRYIMTIVAGIITFGIVYNAARIALAERARDLASLRVMGFTRGEAGFVLLGELAIVTLLALPLGVGLGYWLTYLIVEGFSTDIYQIPVVSSPRAFGVAIFAVVSASVLSGWLVKRDIDRADLVSALKTRE
ncbi:FtsX-like permease family protein [Alisedimentitalea sp. MJ-SS2]|uniref:ABC transporter permease n=1 Tax=Aliisedimentitalea sp. MJ-SS2 TaxID=3049795 RepID=UPI00290A82F0|nr:FtsX-like permease family protein [Alisedimentitalea sp. MJ-SS2]MDU8927343.1 FtsX-like permease family protein [Alisedimentitalea sp. MJ-SS2]